MKSPLIFLLGILDLAGGVAALITISTNSLRWFSVPLLLLIAAKGAWSLVTAS